MTILMGALAGLCFVAGTMSIDDDRRWMRRVGYVLLASIPFNFYIAVIR